MRFMFKNRRPFAAKQWSQNIGHSLPFTKTFNSLLCLKNKLTFLNESFNITEENNAY